MDANHIQSITRNAIESINQLAALVQQSSQGHGQRRLRPVESTAAISSSNNFSRPRPTSSAAPSSSTTTGNCRPITRVSNALTELQRRFPTTRPYSNPNLPSSRSGSQSSSSGAHSRPPPGRPAVYLVTRDVIVMDFDCEKVPSRSEKPKLEQERRIISGFDIDRRWNAKRLHEELETLLPEPWMMAVGFEIVKNSSGSLVKPNIPRNKVIDAQLLFRSIAPSGGVYVRLLAGKPTDDEDDDIFGFDDQLMTASTVILNDNEEKADTEFVSGRDKGKDQDAENEKNKGEPTEQTPSKINCPFAIQPIIDKIKDAAVIDPIEALKILQMDVIQGRPLELATMADTVDGETNFITVDRDNILVSTFSELQYVDNLRLTFNVDFIGEQCVDLGGPRKEWIRMMNHAIKEKYFDHGLREMLAEDYYYVGIMIAVAMLQNGQLPVFMEDNIIQQIISSSSLDQCILQLQRGLEMLGMLSALQQLPMLSHLLRPGAQMALNVQKLLHLLQAKFSEEGSNSRAQEKECYQMFVKYVREVASGRRSVNGSNLGLGDILSFVTGASEEPPLGFQLHPSIEFTSTQELKRNGQEGEASFAACFVPTARTCVNVLSLPRGTFQFPLPTMEKLFALYDEVFCQKFFGVQ